MMMRRRDSFPVSVSNILGLISYPVCSSETDNRVVGARVDGCGDLWSDEGGGSGVDYDAALAAAVLAHVSIRQQSTTYYTVLER